MRVERRVYLEHVGPDPESFIVPDVTVVASDTGPATGSHLPGPAQASAILCTLPQPEQRRETFLVIRERPSLEVVTVIETLSPSNKRRGGDGRREYLAKRDDILTSASHLVELDLLLGGERLPVVEPFPAGDYYCIVSRSHARPLAELYAWSLQQPLPTIPVPLKRGDTDVLLPLQLIFDTVYERAGYGRVVEYTRPLQVAPSPDVVSWIHERVAQSGS